MIPVNSLLKQSPLLAECTGVRHGFGTRKGGVSTGVYDSLNCGWSSGDSLEHVAENRRRIAAALCVMPEALLTCYQVHSPIVVTVKAPWPASDRPQADAMVTAQPGLALGVLTADCVPLLLADTQAGVVGAAHAGWRGAMQGIVGETVAAMQALGAKPDRIVAAIGPCIWQESYEVGPDFAAPFLAQTIQNERFFRPAPRPQHQLFDLPGYVAARLEASGVAAISTSVGNTYTESEDYFSFRRNTHQQVNRMGSLLAAITLEPK